MTKKQAHILVVLATYNGGARLARTLESFCASRAVGDSGWQMLVVDNGSTDDSRAIAISFAKRLPLTLITETRPGKNTALNAGLDWAAKQAKKPDFFLFIDDDILTPTDWLSAWRAELLETPDFDLYGAFVVADWPRGGVPDHILKGADIEHAFSLHPESLSRGAVGYGVIHGNMMGVRPRGFTSGRRFDEAIGPKAGAGGYIPGSESSFNMAAEKAGFRAWMARDIIVAHQVRPDQMTEGWLLGRAYRLGRGQATWDHMLGHRYPSLFGVPRWAWRRCFTSPIKALLMTLVGNEAAALKARWEGARARGMVDESRRLGKG